MWLWKQEKSNMLLYQLILLLILSFSDKFGVMGCCHSNVTIVVLEIYQNCVQPPHRTIRYTPRQTTPRHDTTHHDTAQLKTTQHNQDNITREQHCKPLTWIYWCMYQAACFPSFTDSTVVLATPATSPPQNTSASLVAMVSSLTSGNPHLLNFSGFKAFITNTNNRHNRLYFAKKSYWNIIIFLFM